ncbi:hypothetical protein [Tengunoibacter tsumagoiensis]|uniref:Glycoside hydrolase family 5 domain-containing protein n=1 Tax=Tengunoibacter tsumagoiensis TaxID=2014871 RepID=A0A401ZWI4_9CHLR|nr:hypothetical protein [Tengunoibacter tsumagoiensis]GCE11269.1 hypothetical protein KTT_11280 [Tengunoibacter tsumagoiensis]
MNTLQNALNFLKRPAGIITAVVIIVVLVATSLSYKFVIQSSGHAPAPTPKVVRKPTPTPTPTLVPTATQVPTPTPIILPTQDPAQIQGVDGTMVYNGISWLRMGYPTCGWGDLRGDTLKNTMQDYHSKGIRVLFTICQANNDNLYNTDILNDAAQGHPDAVQCGNEEMKQDASVSFLYTPPDKFAKFYDLCEHAIHAINPGIPVLLGSLDPHVASNDYQLMVNQVNYLDQMQNAMNSSVHPGGNWDWHNQTLGVIDSWHNGYLGANNLAGLFSFWSQQFHVDMNGGELGKHLWVVEGTGCFKGCGINADSSYQVAVSHILTLITDVQTAQQAKVPFFYFSGKDFKDQGIIWPIGILNQDGQPKPIRQDLGMGERTLQMNCPDGVVSVNDQLTLLSKLYNHCSLPGNYIATLVN